VRGALDSAASVTPAAPPAPASAVRGSAVSSIGSEKRGIVGTRVPPPPLPQPLPPQRQPAAAAPVAALRRAQRAAALAAAVRRCDPTKAPLRLTLRSAHCDRCESARDCCDQRIAKNRISAVRNRPLPLRHSHPAQYGVSPCAQRRFVPADYGLSHCGLRTIVPAHNGVSSLRSSSPLLGRTASAAFFPAGTGTLIHPPYS